MSERFEVSATEHGVVRLFAVDLPPEKVADFARPDGVGDDANWPLREALGATSLDPDHVEVFPVSDLTGLGLPGYMVEGLGVARGDVDEDRARLSAVEGHVAVVTSGAFGGSAQTLTPRAPLRWIGTYTEESAPVEFRPLPAGGAEGNAEVAPAPERSKAAISGRVAGVALLVLALLVAVMIWVAA